MAYTYLWDAPYLDFSSEAIITYKKANTSDKPKPAQFSITEGNALLSFDNPGSYKVYAVDKGIRYERTINIHKIAPSLEGSGLSEEDVERLKSDVVLQVKTALKDEPYEVPELTINSVVERVTEQVKTALKEEPLEVPQPTIESVVQRVTTQVNQQVTAQVAEQVRTALQEGGGGGTGSGPSLVYNDDGTFALG